MLQPSYSVSFKNELQANTLAPQKILIVEDDPDIAKLIQLHLAGIYQTVCVCHDGVDAYQLAREQSWDLLILDIRLPRKDGLEICRDLRANQFDMPIVMLTSQSNEMDRVLGLEMGADDYVTKPFGITELTARVKARLRRIVKVNAHERSPTLETIHISEHNLTLNTRLRTLLINYQDIPLTAKEFDLMHYFLQNPGTVFSRTDLLNKIWGYSHAGYEHTVNSHINRLRAKVEQDPAKPKMITTKWGVGYQFNDSKDAIVQ